MKKKVFFFDIDGTLLPIGINHVLNSTRYAIKQLINNGHEVYIATGKAHKDTKWLGDILGIKNYITANGQVIYKNNEIVYEEYIDSKLLTIVEENAIKNNLTLGFQGNDESSVIKGEGYRDLCSFFEHVNIAIPKQIKSFDNEFNVTQMWIAGDTSKVEVPEELRIVNWPETGADIIYKYASKGNSISKFFDQQLYETYAFGDGDNDIEMFRHCEHAIAMGNATDYVKSFANEITDDSTSNGIYNYLVKHNLINEKEQTKLAFIDIDGTLLKHEHDEIDEEVVNAVKELKENGIEPFICTGRNYHAAKKFIDKLQMESYITSNGQEVVYKGNTLDINYIEEEKFKEIVNIIEELNVAWAYETRENIFLTDSEHASEIQKAIKAQGFFDIEISSDKYKSGVFQVWAFGTKEEVDRVQNAVKSKYTFYRWEDNAIEILATKCNKGVGISKLLNEFDGYAYTYGFGDGSNDLEMMDIVDTSVAMGNAIDDLKAVCDITTKDCVDNGLVDAFKHLGLIGE